MKFFFIVRKYVKFGTKSLNLNLLWLELFKLVKLLLFEFEIFSNFYDSSLGHFDKINTSQCIS